MITVCHSVLVMLKNPREIMKSEFDRCRCVCSYKFVTPSSELIPTVFIVFTNICCGQIGLGLNLSTAVVKLYLRACGEF
jgi:hypothetical protein